MAGGVGELPSDDVLSEIFSRLPEPVDLLRCAGTFKSIYISMYEHFIITPNIFNFYRRYDINKYNKK
jgi:hypothetical protein